MYCIRAILFIGTLLSVINAGDIYRVHTYAAYDNQDVELQYRSDAAQYNGIVAKACQNIKATTLKHNSCAVIFHGRTGSGKSSLVERLLQKEFQAIHSPVLPQEGEVIIGDTQYCQDYNLIADGNKFIVMDTPGFGERHILGQDMVLRGCAQALEKLKDLKVDLIGLYFVMDSLRTSYDEILQSLLFLQGMYGRAAKQARIIVNKADRIAPYGKQHVMDLVDTITSAFKDVFQVAPPKIMFTCAYFYTGLVMCFGQLLTDLCIKEHDEFIARCVKIDEGEALKLVKQIQDLEEKIKTRITSKEHALTELLRIQEQLREQQASHQELLEQRTHIDRVLVRTQSTIDARQTYLNKLEQDRDAIVFVNLDGCYKTLNTDEIIAELQCRCSNLDLNQQGEDTIYCMVKELVSECPRLKRLLPFPYRDNLINHGAAVLQSANFAMGLVKMHRPYRTQQRRCDSVQSEIDNLTSIRATKHNELLHNVHQLDHVLNPIINRLQEQQQTVQNNLANIDIELCELSAELAKTRKLIE